MYDDPNITHCLDQAIAKKAGVNAALIYERIRHYCNYHRTNGSHFYEGSYWCFNSYKAWQEQFKFLSERQIRTAIDKLEKENFIKVGNFNTKSYDKTKWYTLEHQQTATDTDDTPMTQKSKGSDTEVKPIPKHTNHNKHKKTIVQKPRRKTIVTDEWFPNPSPESKAYAIMQRMSQETLNDELTKFKNYHIGKQTKSADWERSWSTWCINWKKWNEQKPRSTGNKSGSSALFNSVTSEVAENFQGEPSDSDMRYAGRHDTGQGSLSLLIEGD